VWTTGPGSNRHTDTTPGRRIAETLAEAAGSVGSTRPPIGSGSDPRRAPGGCGRSRLHAVAWIEPRASASARPGLDGAGLRVAVPGNTVSDTASRGGGHGTRSAGQPAGGPADAAAQADGAGGVPAAARRGRWQAGAALAVVAVSPTRASTIWAAALTTLAPLTIRARVRLGARRARGSPRPRSQLLREKIRRKNRNTFRMSRKIDAASSGADLMSFEVRNRWKSTIVKTAKMTRPMTE
jgi:hypothetical protein